MTFMGLQRLDRERQVAEMNARLQAQNDQAWAEQKQRIGPSG